MSGSRLCRSAVTRLNEALEGCYAIERELGEGGMRTHRAQRNVRLKKSTVRCHANVAAASS